MSEPEEKRGTLYVEPFDNQIQREEEIHQRLAEALIQPHGEDSDEVRKLRAELEEIYRNARTH